jgi:hypothetical protein
MLNHNNWSGHFSCTKCLIKGSKNINEAMDFSELNCSRRDSYKPFCAGSNGESIYEIFKIKYFESFHQSLFDDLHVFYSNGVIDVFRKIYIESFLLIEEKIKIEEFISKIKLSKNLISMKILDIKKIFKGGGNKLFIKIINVYLYKI